MQTEQFQDKKYIVITEAQVKRLLGSILSEGAEIVDDDEGIRFLFSKELIRKENNFSKSSVMYVDSMVDGYIENLKIHKGQMIKLEATIETWRFVLADFLLGYEKFTE